MLLFAYHFPPSTRIGAVRWQEFAHYFSDAGWELDIVTCPPDPTADHCDPGLLDELPPGLRLFAVPHPEHPLRRLEKSVVRFLKERRHSNGAERSSGRDNGAGPQAGSGAGANGGGDNGGGTDRPSIPREAIRWNLTEPRNWMRMYWGWLLRERQLIWARDAAELGHRLASAVDYDLVLCSSPPHESQLAGAAVAEKADLPFVMDLRDPWSHAPHLPDWIASPVTTHYDNADERHAVERAALVVANTEALEEALTEKHPSAAERLVTVRNGFDDPGEMPAAPPSDRFSVRFAGSIYYNRDPRPVLKGAARVIRELGLAPERFEIRMIGRQQNSDPIDFSDLVNDLGIEDYCSFGGWLPREEVRGFMEGAQVLVTVPGGNPFGIPAKVYDYMRYRAWILALADEASATGRLLAETEAEVVAPDDAGAVARALTRLYGKFERGIVPEPLARHREFGRKAQASRLIDAVERLPAMRLEPRRTPRNSRRPTRNAPRAHPLARSPGT